MVWGPAVGAGVGLGAKPESAEGPAEEEHRSGDEHRLATDFSADRECGFASEPGTGLGFGSTLCTADAG